MQVLPTFTIHARVDAATPVFISMICTTIVTPEEISGTLQCLDSTCLMVSVDCFYPRGLAKVCFELMAMTSLRIANMVHPPASAQHFVIPTTVSQPYHNIFAWRHDVSPLVLRSGCVLERQSVPNVRIRKIAPHKVVDTLGITLSFAGQT